MYAQVTFAGRLAQLKATWALNEFRDCTVQVLVGAPPGTVFSVEGAQLKVKSAVAAHGTRSGWVVAQALARPKQEVFDPTGITTYE